MFNTKPAKDVRAIRQGTPDFTLNDGMVIYPRAMIHILPQCPMELRDQINFAIAKGYIQMVSHVYGKELTMDALR
jgi:hypothetical protein